MSEKNRSKLSHWYHSQDPDSAVRNLLMTASVAMVAALTVSTAAMLLQPVYQEKQTRLRQASMKTLVDKIPSLEALLSASDADTFESRLVNLDTGCYETSIDASTFDSRKAASDPLLSTTISKQNGEEALLKSRSKYELVHLLFNGDDLQLSIFPIHGPGYQSTLYAWLVLAADLNTIVALNVYEHGDTPGIGSRVENADWQASWQDKQLFDQSGSVAIKVVKNSSGSLHEVDGISGATRTSMGVGNMVEFWVGKHGFGPFLDMLKSGKSC